MAHQKQPLRLHKKAGLRWMLQKGKLSDDSWGKTKNETRQEVAVKKNTTNMERLQILWWLLRDWMEEKVLNKISLPNFFLTFFEVGLLKFGAMSFGILASVYFHDFVTQIPLMWVWWIALICSIIYFITHLDTINDYE